mgnify:FL=1
MSGINKTGAQPTQLPSLSFEGTQKPAAPSTETNAIDRLNLSFDSFEVGPSTSRPASEKGRRAVETFHNKLDSIMNPDAMALANGARPVNPGDAFTDAQKDRLVGAAKDMMMDMPLPGQRSSSSRR